MDDNEKIYEKLKFVIIFRLLAASVIISVYIITQFNSTNRHENFIYPLLTALIFLSILYYLLLRYIKKIQGLNEKFLTYFGFVQLFADLFFISTVVLFNGGLNSKLIFLYYLLILIGGFIFLRLGALVFSVASSIAIGLLADFQYYFNFNYHLFFLSNPDKLLFLASINILGVLIFGLLLYRFSGGMKVLSKKMVEMDEFIRNSQNFNKELINSFSQGLIVLDGNYKIVFINKSAVEILEIDAYSQTLFNKLGVLFNYNIGIKDILNNFPVDVLAVKNEIHDISDKKKNKKSEAGRFEIKHKNNILGFTYAEFINQKDFPGKFMLFFRDITTIRQAEIESKINEGLMTAGKFAGWLAHEVRNPLLAINTSVNVLNSQNLDYDSGDYKKLLDIIKTETLRLDNLVNDFLGFAKIKSKNAGHNYGQDSRSRGNHENINIFMMINDLISIFSNLSEDTRGDKAKVIICNRVEPDINIFFEKYRIHQILLNILQNSVQSIRESNVKNKAGLIRFSAKIIQNSSGKNIFLLCLADNGAGMDNFTLKNIFKPLFTTKEKGLGLGLSIVYSIVENFEGDIKINSRPNKGTLIAINLPM